MKLLSSLLAIAFSISNLCFASVNIYKSNHLADLQSQSVIPKETLVVLDIDNTLLRMKTYIGSPSWFAWQQKEISTQQADAMATSIGQFYPINDFTLQLAHAKACETNPNTGTAHTIKALQSQGYTVIAETARDPKVAAATKRELIRNGINFSKHGIPTDPTQQCLVIKYHADKKTPLISYCQGILYTTGGKKAETLNLLLNKLKASDRYSTILFADDSESNIDNFANYYKNKKTKAYLYHYLGAQAWAQKFHPNSTTRSRDNLILDLYQLLQ